MGIAELAAALGAGTGDAVLFDAAAVAAGTAVVVVGLQVDAVAFAAGFGAGLATAAAVLEGDLGVDAGDVFVFGGTAFAVTAVVAAGSAVLRAERKVRDALTGTTSGVLAAAALRARATVAEACLDVGALAAAAQRFGFAGLETAAAVLLRGAEVGAARAAAEETVGTSGATAPALHGADAIAADL